jgi:hypothetical protein
MSIVFSISLNDKATACNNYIGNPALKTKLSVCTRAAINYDLICRSDRLHKPGFPNPGNTYTDRSQSGGNY